MLPGFSPGGMRFQTEPLPCASPHGRPSSRSVCDRMLHRPFRMAFSISRNLYLQNHRTPKLHCNFGVKPSFLCPQFMYDLPSIFLNCCLPESTVAARPEGITGIHPEAG